MFSLFNFSSVFPGESADPICPYVRTPMAASRTAIGGGHIVSPPPERQLVHSYSSNRRFKGLLHEFKGWPNC